MPVDYVQDTCSPWWLRIAGTWVKVEGIEIDLQVTKERPSSTFTALGGRRYAQRAALGRRTWAVSLTRATPAGIAALAAATELDDVWLASDHVLETNMLPPRSCFGTGAAVDCGGLGLPGFTGDETLTAYVRGGIPTTLAAWAAGPTGSDTSVTYPGGATDLVSAAGQFSVTFTPSTDGVVTIQPSAAISGLTLTEGTPPELWTPGQSMPCKVVVEDPDETLRGFREGAYRSDYGVRLVEVD